MCCLVLKLIFSLTLALHASPSRQQLPPEPTTTPTTKRTLLIENADEYVYTYDWVYCSGTIEDASYFYLCDCWVGESVYNSCEASGLPHSWASEGPGAVRRQGESPPKPSPRLKRIIVASSPSPPLPQNADDDTNKPPNTVVPSSPPAPTVFPVLPPPDKYVGNIPSLGDIINDKKPFPIPFPDYFAPSPTSLSSTNTTSSSADVGAIVGGVIGGVAAIALAAVGALFIYKRRTGGNKIMHQPPEPSINGDSLDAEKQDKSMKHNVAVHGSASSITHKKPPPPPLIPPIPALSPFSQQQQDTPTDSPFMQSYLNSDLRNDPVLSLVAVTITSSSPRGDENSSSSDGKKSEENNNNNSSSGRNASRLFSSTEMASQPPPLLGSSASLVDIRPWQFNFQELSIEHVIGTGSFGKVYRAKWREVLVAAKVLLDPSGGGGASQPPAASSPLSLSSSLLKKLEDEATLLASLRHPNVVQFLGFCSFPPCIITEYCDRGSLLDVLQRAKRDESLAALLTWKRRVKMAIEAAGGLLFLHSQNIIHRDFKSPNLLITDSLRVKITDFNLSKIMEEAANAEGAAAVVSSMSVVTNPRWMSSEQVMGAKATIQSDVFSFGVVMWELLTWNIPWEGANTWAIVGAISNGRRLKVPDVKDLPGGKDTAGFKGLGDYIRIMERCWDQDPAKRPDVSTIISELRRLI